MAIDHRLARAILREHKHRPISGTVLLFGRQTVVLTPEQALALLEDERVDVRPSWKSEQDRSTFGADGRGLITDRSFFGLFSDAKVIALDVSDYEGAEIVADLNEPVDRSLWETADFAFNGSCLDNMFDAASAMKNMSRILRPGGRIMHIEHGSPVQGAYVMYSPAYFFDYYAINDFADCKVFCCMFNGMLDPWNVFLWEPYFDVDGEWLLSGHIHPAWANAVSLVVAEKGEASSADRTPVQGFYRHVHGGADDAILRAMLSFRGSGRELFQVPTVEMKRTETDPGGFSYLGVLEDPTVRRQSRALALIDTARLAAREQRVDVAIAAYSEAIVTCPSVGFPGLVYAERGDLYGFLGDYDRAIEDYDEALRMHPDPSYVSRRRDALVRRGSLCGIQANEHSAHVNPLMPDNGDDPDSVRSE